jgi:hypothetical protein
VARNRIRPRLGRQPRGPRYRGRLTRALAILAGNVPALLAPSSSAWVQKEAPKP